ncbi:carbon storage regulator CsrA [Sinobacterium caligoides]|uniref:Carbon storage regulator CsrA n=2 Tax=Sinobacterium caligoides TaxID=933926 RepID=A0A3N2E062_9GAMM|nr:carbon storage regulator CsrA [Sinobacterium caligoides]
MPLSLQRSINQSIVINGDIIITVRQSLFEGSVELQVSAPNNMRIDRAEIHKRREAEKGRSWRLPRLHRNPPMNDRYLAADKPAANKATTLFKGTTISFRRRRSQESSTSLSENCSTP